MFGSKKSSLPQNSLDSLIGVGTRVEGNIVFKGGLRVDGEVRGSISSESGRDGTLVVSEKASVEGAISVGHVVVNGVVIGPIVAAESLELLPSARVTGDVEYHQIEMQQGAVIQGRLVHQAGAGTSVELKLAASNS
jgi:cytoskeletal protein CcmA (bactofilin family)